MTTHAWATYIPDAKRREPRVWARRVLNILVAGIGLLVTLPLMALIALAVKLSSSGPVRYVQVRIGIDRRRRDLDANTGGRRVDLGGRPFTMFKFRTMHSDVNATQQWATSNDARITGIGRILRQYRIDELPQLINVLKGDMNVVGPRPEQPMIFAQLRDRIGRYAHRQRVHPGITGWAQINLAYDRNEEDVRRKLGYDLEYIERQSLSEDVRIMARTLPVMLFRRGAQ